MKRINKKLDIDQYEIITKETREERAERIKYAKYMQTKVVNSKKKYSRKNQKNYLKTIDIYD